MSVERIKRLRAGLSEWKVDAVIISNPTNVRYLSGFTGSEGTLLITGRGGYFFTDFRYTMQAKDQVQGAKVNIFTNKMEEIAKIVGRLKIKRIGFEGDHVSVNFSKQLEKACEGKKLVPLGNQIDMLRICKEPEEIEAIRAVIAVAEKAYRKAARKLVPGVTENEVAQLFFTECLRGGATGLSFDSIVASGPRGAMPHGVASDKVIENGELVVFDHGAVMNGYCSDQTMTVPVGPQKDIHQRVYSVVYEAQQRAIEAVRPGITGPQLDAVARNIIDRAGYKKFFGHGLGHGVGMEIHEDPRASFMYHDLPFEPGMVVTIEPGIYLPGEFGIRLEDIVVVTETGCEVLTTLDKAWKGEPKARVG